MYRIIETKDFYPLSVLFNHSGLEVDITDEAPATTVNMWKCEDEEGKLLAGLTIEKKSGLYVLSNIAVIEEMRGTGLGKELLDFAEKEARALNAAEFWLVGKVPGFYKKYGWEEVQSADAPEISGCLTCKQFGNTCFPVVMKKTFE